MASEFQQSVLNATGKNGSAIAAFWATVLTGSANFFEVVQPIIGGVTSLVVFAMACIIFRKKDKLFDKELELKEAQIRAISDRKADREEGEDNV